VPAFQPFDPLKPLVATRRPSDKPVWELGGLLAGSIVADIETSQAAIHSGLRVRELNPLMRTRAEAYALNFAWVLWPCTMAELPVAMDASTGTCVSWRRFPSTALVFS